MKITVAQMIDSLLSVRNQNAELIIRVLNDEGDSTIYDSRMYDIYVTDGTEYFEDDGMPDDEIKDKVSIDLYR